MGCLGISVIFPSGILGLVADSDFGPVGAVGMEVIELGKGLALSARPWKDEACLGPVGMNTARSRGSG